MAEMSHPGDEQGSTQATAQPVSDGQSTRPVYEVGFHLVPSTPEDGAGAAVEHIRALLGSAEIISEGFPQKMTLAYTIEVAQAGKRETFTQAYFGWIKFAVEERSAIPAIEAGLRAMRQVLRSIIIETTREDVKQKQQAVFASDRLEGKVLEKPTEVEKKGEVSQEELDRSLEGLTG